MQTVKLYSLNYTESRTYVAAALFIVGNIVLPQLFHLIPKGGPIFLPIYFFTLIGAYKYGWRVGLLTAVLSHLVNSALFGMPAAAMLPIIMAKSVFLALAASFMAWKFKKISLLLLAATAVAYQSAGTLFEWAYTGSLVTALQDVRTGIPGLLLQIFGGLACIKYIVNK